MGFAGGGGFFVSIIERGLCNSVGWIHLFGGMPMVTFKSQAAGNVLMFDDVARQMLIAIGKSPDKQGTITVDQLPEAIAKLKQAAAENRVPPANEDEERDSELRRTPPGGERRFVSLAQRAAPLIELCEHSLKAEKPVVWGV
jgi:hypothetical protein